MDVPGTAALSGPAEPQWHTASPCKQCGLRAISVLHTYLHCFGLLLHHLCVIIVC